MEYNRPPKEVIIGAILLAVATSLEVIRTVREYSSFFDPEILILVSVLPYISLAGVLIYKIIRGKNWARTIYMILIAIEIFLLVGSSLNIFSVLSDPLEIVLSAFEVLSAAFAIAFLYSKRSDTWIVTKTEREIITPERKNRVRRILIFSALAIFLVFIILIVSYISPEEIVNKIGIRNGYIVAFIASFFGGFSAFTTVSFYSILIAFVSGGLNPVLLSLIAGASLSLGDIFLFYFGRKGRDMISGKLDREINRLAYFFSRRNLEKHLPLFAYIYISFIPLPNDWLLLFMASIKFPQKRMNLIIVLGDFTHAAILTFLTTKGIMIFA